MYRNLLSAVATSNVFHFVYVTEINHQAHLALEIHLHIIVPSFCFTTEDKPDAMSPSSSVVEPGADSHVNLGMFTDRRGAYRMLGTEGELGKIMLLPSS